MTINILNILHDTTVDGPGFRTSIYCAGCRHACKGCHNPQSWDFNGGHAMEVDELLQEVLSDPFADVTFSGGDPLYQAEGFAELARRIKSESKKTIWCYTGFLFEELLHNTEAMELLAYTDVLVDGPFMQDLRDEELLFRGSRNQRIIDVQPSLRLKEAVLWERTGFDI